MDRLKNFLLAVFCDYGYMVGKYNAEYDRKFNELLNEYEFEIVSSYYAKLGDNEFWIENRPYSCFALHTKAFNGDAGRIRPSRLTIYRALKKLDKKIKQISSLKNKQIVSEL